MNSSSGLASTSRTKTNQNIQVYVRVRPLNAREKSIRSLEVVDVPSSREVVVRQMFDTKTTKKFTFDRTFDPHSKQPEVYQSVVAPLIEEVLAGYNCTVFAYGQTGTGKTHTMVGTECPEMKSSWEDNSMIGIIPRALTHLFDELRLMEVEFSMRVSYLELYNEELCDLLSTDDDVKIRIFDDASKKGSVIIQGLEEITVHTKDDVYKLLKKGQERRKTATTLMNAQSSRSHTVFSILVHIKENGMDGEELLKIGKLNLVDLAGSENISKAGNEKGIRARETVNINQSLLTLGRVITALVERTPHIPYRESKLTRLLQESLGGRTKTSIIATISPGHKDLEETLSTLEYAHRAKNIQNRPELNQKLTKKTVIKEYTEEIDRLKKDLMAARDKNGIYLAEETYIDMHSKLESQNKELNEKVLLLKALKDELANKEGIFNEVSLHLVEKSEQLKKTENVLVTTKSELDQTKRVLTTTKRRYKEKKLLVDTHLKTEVELTNQATQLIEVADIATNDTSKLHNTIERRKNVDQKIKLTCDQFASNCQQTFDKMDESLENLLATHSSHSEVILDDIATNIEQHDIFSTSIKDGLSKIEQYQNACRDDMSETFQKYLNLLNGSNAEYEKLFLALFSEWNATENKNRQKMDDLVIQMLNSLNAQNRILAEKSCHTRKFIETQHENVVNYVNSATNELEQLSGDVKSYMANSVQDIEATSSKLSDLGKKEFDLIAQLKESLENLSLVRAEKSQVESHLNQISGHLKETEKKINCKVQSQSKSAKQFVNEFTSQHKKAQDSIVETEGEVSVLSKQWNNHIDDLKATNCDYHETSILTINEIQKTSSDCRDKFEETGEIIKKEFADKQEKSQKTLTTYNKEAVDMISSEHMRLKLYATQSSAFNKIMQHNIAEYANTYRGQITQCRQEVHNFHTNELKTYTPSGETPSKKEFLYPRILAATSPHDRIIKRFRMENDWSDLDTTSPITEDSEITLHDLTDDQIMVNSTPLKPKTENDNLKVFPREFNFKIPSSKTNSPALFECSPPEENKENSGIKLEP